ncbi:uncharacterized protein [Nicotiana tomentosiformis]|uniref:uncharacterized protein n=1 Tax=Nicotiana tomentosiformis TaxID=4098 RepID=UPI00388C5655
MPKVKWRGSLDYLPNRVISYLKAHRMVGKVGLSYLEFVRDVDAYTPTIDSVPIVRDFLDVFHADMSGMPPDRDIDFGINLVYGTQPISIPLYRMSPIELKELKEELQELFERWYYADVQRIQVVKQSYNQEQDTVLHDDAKDVTIGDDGMLRMQCRICVPNVDGLRELILEEDHSSWYSIHPGAANMYQELRQHYWWRRMKKDIVGFWGSWDQFLPLAEFSYNYSYQLSIHMAQYEALYGRRCRSPVGWFELGEASLLGTDLVQDALDKVKLIQDRLPMTQSRKKCYADMKVRDVAYMVGEKVLLQVERQVES